MHDLRFSEGLKLHFLGGAMNPPLVNPACIEAEKSYRQNYLRAFGLIGIPGLAFVTGEAWVAAREVVKTTHADLDARVVDFVSGVKAFTDKRAGKDVEGEYFARFQRGTENTVNYLCRAEPYHAAFHSLLQSIVILAWTAFESLAQDLHMLSREKHSECFSPEAMGPKKYHFHRLAELPISYSRAFGDDPAIISQVENADVRALGLLRHLMIHKSGVVDQMHLDERMKSPIVSQLDLFGLHSTVELTGDLVSSLINPVTLHAYGLLRSVDSWLTTHKPV